MDILMQARRDIRKYRLRSNLMDLLSEMTGDLTTQGVQDVLGASEQDVTFLRTGRVSQLPLDKLVDMWREVN